MATDEDDQLEVMVIEQRTVVLMVSSMEQGGG